MTSIPPWPSEFLMRVVTDTRQALRFDDTRIRARMASSVTERTGIVEAEAQALALLERRWSSLAGPLTWSLAQVERDYAEHPGRVARLRAELAREGAEAWIAQSVRAQLAFDLGFEAVAESDGCLDL